uniref:Uncharacterized protein n=1 Tax=Sphaerodactylus townsendi TaxID=933632 RepID=A0ACB8EQV0_9SAUR
MPPKRSKSRELPPGNWSPSGQGRPLLNRVRAQTGPGVEEPDPVVGRLGAAAGGEATWCAVSLSLSPIGRGIRSNLAVHALAAAEQARVPEQQPSTSVGAVAAEPGPSGSLMRNLVDTLIHLSQALGGSSSVLSPPSGALDTGDTGLPATTSLADQGMMGFPAPAHQFSPPGSASMSVDASVGTMESVNVNFDHKYSTLAER